MGSMQHAHTTKSIVNMTKKAYNAIIADIKSKHPNHEEIIQAFTQSLFIATGFDPHANAPAELILRKSESRRRRKNS
jgi:hypothetical protein